MRRTAGVLGGILAGATLTLAVTAMPPPSYAGSGDIAEAEKALEAKDYDKALSFLQRVTDEKAQTARFHYLMGVTLFDKAEGLTAAKRTSGDLDPDKLHEEQVEMFRKSLDHLRRVVSLDAGGADTPDAHYRAAVLLDYGYLQRFDQVKDEYTRVVELYPGTEAARKAQVKLDYHNKLFQHFKPEEGTPSFH